MDEFIEPFDTGLAPLEHQQRGQWFEFEHGIWHCIAFARRYTWFRNKWYREHEDQSFKMQRSASEGTPLLFSGGLWFEEYPAGPPAADANPESRSTSPAQSYLDVNEGNRSTSPAQSYVNEGDNLEAPDDEQYHMTEEEMQVINSISFSPGLGSGYAYGPSVVASASMATLRDPIAELRNPFADDQVIDDEYNPSYTPTVQKEYPELIPVGQEAATAAPRSATTSGAISFCTNSNTSTRNTIISSNITPSHSHISPNTTHTSYQQLPTSSRNVTQDPAAATGDPPLPLAQRTRLYHLWIKEVQTGRKDLAAARKKASRETRDQAQRKALARLDELLCRTGRPARTAGLCDRLRVRWATGHWWTRRGHRYPHLFYREAKEVLARVEREATAAVETRFARQEEEMLRALADRYAPLVHPHLTPEERAGLPPPGPERSRSPSSDGQG